MPLPALNKYLSDQVCLATSGPGAANLVTGIADSSSDSTPLVAINGNVDALREERARNRARRSGRFPEPERHFLSIG